MIVYINHVINDGGVIGVYVNVDAEVSASRFLLSASILNNGYRIGWRIDRR